MHVHQIRATQMPFAIPVPSMDLLRAHVQQDIKVLIVLKISMSVNKDHHANIMEFVSIRLDHLFATALKVFQDPDVRPMSMSANRIRVKTMEAVLTIPVPLDVFVCQVS